MNETPELISRRCAAIELLVLDVDGVLTDGRIIYSDQGTEIKAFHVRDGAAIRWWREQNKEAAFLTGRISRAVDARAAELGITLVVQGAGDKLSAFRQLLLEARVEPAQACYIGDDLPDLPVLAHCGFAVAVADACPEVAAMAHYVTRSPGGAGAVRESIELLLRAQNCWNKIVEKYGVTRHE
jgi:3-deoxy-D-manno-octulosonate 8-phosphate phosphatase (KDO 8-P phosphatase)